VSCRVSSTLFLFFLLLFVFDTQLSCYSNRVGNNKSSEPLRNARTSTVAARSRIFKKAFFTGGEGRQACGAGTGRGGGCPGAGNCFANFDECERTKNRARVFAWTARLAPTVEYKSNLCPRGACAHARTRCVFRSFRRLRPLNSNSISACFLHRWKRS